MYSWSIDPQAGALSSLSPSPPVNGPQSSIAFEVSGKFATVGSIVTSKTGPNCFAVLELDATTGTMTQVPGSPFPTLGSDCGELVADSTAAYIYSANSKALSVVSLDETTGAPSVVAGIATDFYSVLNVVVTH
jgi:hypothetical protein